MACSIAGIASADGRNLLAGGHRTLPAFVSFLPRESLRAAAANCHDLFSCRAIFLSRLDAQFVVPFYSPLSFARASPRAATPCCECFEVHSVCLFLGHFPVFGDQFFSFLAQADLRSIPGFCRTRFMEFGSGSACANVCCHAPAPSCIDAKDAFSFFRIFSGPF